MDIISNPNHKMFYQVDLKLAADYEIRDDRLNLLFNGEVKTFPIVNVTDKYVYLIESTPYFCTQIFKDKHIIFSEVYVQNFKRFNVGRVFMTQGAMANFSSNSIYMALALHKRGDWGKLDTSDKLSNDAATFNKDRILSSYSVRGEGFWIITDAGHETTTVLLPSEY